MSKNPIGIVGHGYVGKALEYGFKQEPIFIHDKYKASLSLEKVCQKSEFIFICVPTPALDNYAGIDLSIVYGVVDRVARLIKGTNKVIVLKSSIIPGTTASLIKKYPAVKICCNPEFLTEKNYLQDFIKADRVVIGSLNPKISSKVKALYKKHFPKQKVFVTDPTSAEMVKYMANTFLATKVLFGYEMFGLCKKLGIDYMKVKKMVVADQRIEDTHLNVHSSDTANSNTTDRMGFGGKCFPKDMVALIGLGKKLGVDLGLLEKVWEKNQKIRKVHDWIEIPGAVSENKNFHKS